MTEDKAERWAAKNLWTFRGWLQSQTGRADRVGLHARSALRFELPEDPPGDGGDRDGAVREYEEARVALIGRSVAPLPDELAALLRCSYLNPSDTGRHCAVADWLHERPCPTPVQATGTPWRWMCVRALWESLGERPPRWWRYPVSWGQSGVVPWDHFGRTVFYRLEGFVTEPYGSFDRALSAVLAVAPRVDAVVFASREAYHNPGCHRIGFLPPDDLIKPGERRPHVVN